MCDFPFFPSVTCDDCLDFDKQLIIVNDLLSYPGRFKDLGSILFSFCSCYKMFDWIIIGSYVASEGVYYIHRLGYSRSH